MTPFRRDGHLTDLALDYALDGSTLPGTDAHLETCAVCRNRMEAADAIELPALPSSVGPPATVLEPANRSWALILGPIAAAAVALLVAVPLLSGGGPETDGVRIKGSANLSMAVFKDAGDKSTRLRDGDSIAPGDRLGFRISHPAGHLMIVGIDGQNEPYLCYPQGGTTSSEKVEEARSARALKAAIRMDGTQGRERLIAVLCTDSFEFDAMAEALVEGRLLPGCSSEDMSLNKP